MFGPRKETKHKKICVTIKVNEEQKEDDEETNTNINLPLKQVCMKDIHVHVFERVNLHNSNSGKLLCCHE